jgi:structural maintenance of chromosome 4
VDNHTSTKRKRNQSDADVDEYSADEKENVTKSSSTSRKSTSVRSVVAVPKPRNRATRSQSSLKQVPETDEDSPPPVKRKRPSTETEPEQEDEDSSGGDVEDLDQVTNQRAPVTRRSSINKVAKDGMDGAQKGRGSKGNTRSSVNRKGSVGPSRRSARVSSRPVEEEPISILVSDDDDEPAVRSRPLVRNPPKYSEDEDKSDHKPHVSKGRSTAVKSNVLTNNPGVKSHRIVESSEDDELKNSTHSPKLDSPTENASEPGPNISTADGESDTLDHEVGEGSTHSINKAEPVSHVEEEQSLLDTSSAVPPRSQPATVHSEELKGPQARLVIHKMALVNFKSYAGRQEIGPFHKV